MKGELLIRDTSDRSGWIDAWETYGVSMGDGFVDALLSPAPLKDMVESDCRLLDGKTVITASARVGSRDVTLPFTILGVADGTLTAAESFAERRAAFTSRLQEGAVTLRVPALGDEAYSLVYKKSASYGQNRARTICTLSVKFDEPNPADRTWE